MKTLITLAIGLLLLTGQGWAASQKCKQQWKDYDAWYEVRPGKPPIPFHIRMPDCRRPVKKCRWEVQAMRVDWDMGMYPKTSDVFKMPDGWEIISAHDRGVIWLRRQVCEEE